MNNALMEANLSFLQQNIVAILIILVCVLVLKGIALWKAAKAEQKWWFIALLAVNTLGILEIIYIIFVSKKAKEENTDNNQDSQI